MTSVARCTRCRRILTDPFSIAIGMGPECRGGLRKKGWRFPKPVYRVISGHVELVKMIGKVEPPPLGDLTGKAKRKVKHDRS